MDLFLKKKKIVVGGKNPRGKLSSLCMKAVTSVGETETRGQSQDAPERLRPSLRPGSADGHDSGARAARLTRCALLTFHD